MISKPMRDKYGRFVDIDPYKPQLVHEAGDFRVFSQRGLDDHVFMLVADSSASGGLWEFLEGPDALQRAVAYAQELHWTRVFDLDQ